MHLPDDAKDLRITFFVYIFLPQFIYRHHLLHRKDHSHVVEADDNQDSVFKNTQPWMKREIAVATLHVYVQLPVLLQLYTCISSRYPKL